MHQIMTQPTGKGTLICRSPYTYKDVTIVHGVESNGANIPRILWSIVPPFYPDHITATFFHDYLCACEQYEKADQYFEELLVLGGVSKFKVFMMTKAVRTWHKVAYKKETNQARVWLNLYRKVRNYEY